MVPIALDTETALIEPGLLAPPLTCVSVSDGTTTALEHVHGNARALVAELLSVPIVGQNVAYDMAVIMAEWPELGPLIFRAYESDRVTCTMVREKLQHIAIGTSKGYVDDAGGWVRTAYSLASMAKRRLHMTLDKSTYRLGYGPLRDVPLDRWDPGARAYAQTDALTTWRVWQDQNDYPQYLEDEFRQTRAAWWLHLASCRGLVTDPAAVQVLAQRYQAQAVELERTLMAKGLLRSNGTRNIKAAKDLMQSVDADPVRTKAGDIALDKDTCDATGHPILVAYGEYGAVKHKLSTDIPMLAKPLIQARFESLLTTGRTSSSPNVQNIPRMPGFRECFVPRPGYVFATADYSGFELCTMAQACLDLVGHSALATVLNMGLDPHLEVARHILGCTCDEALARFNAGNETVILARQTGKVANFGFPGGLGIARFVKTARKQYQVALDEQQARELKELWLYAYPEFRDYFRTIGTYTEHDSAQIKQLRSGRYRGDVSYTETCNSYFQGLAADAAKDAGFAVAKACYVEPMSPLYGSHIVNFVHDEFVLESPTDRAPEAAEELARIMCERAQVWIPHVRIKAEPCLSDRWSKKARSVRGPNGRLQICNIELS